MAPMPVEIGEVSHSAAGSKRLREAHADVFDSTAASGSSNATLAEVPAAFIRAQYIATAREKDSLSRKLNVVERRLADVQSEKHLAEDSLRLKLVESKKAASRQELDAMELKHKNKALQNDMDQLKEQISVLQRKLSAYSTTEAGASMPRSHSKHSGTNGFSKFVQTEVSGSLHAMEGQADTNAGTLAELQQSQARVLELQTNLDKVMSELKYLHGREVRMSVAERKAENLEILKEQLNHSNGRIQMLDEEVQVKDNTINSLQSKCEDLSSWLAVPSNLQGLDTATAVIACVQQLRQQNVQAESRISALQIEIAELKAKAESAQERAQVLQTSQNDMKADKQQLESQVQSISAELVRDRAELQECRRALSSILPDKASEALKLQPQLQAEIQTLRDKQNELVAQQQQQLLEQQQQLEKSSASALNAKHVQMTQAISQQKQLMEQASSNHKKEMMQAGNKLKQSESKRISEVKALREQLQQQKNKASSAELQLQAKQATLTAAQKKISELTSSGSETAKRTAALEAEVSQLREKESLASAALQASERSLKEAKIQLEVVENSNKQLVDQQVEAKKSAQNDMKDNVIKIHGLESDLQQAKTQIATSHQESGELKATISKLQGELVKAQSKAAIAASAQATAEAQSKMSLASDPHQAAKSARNSVNAAVHALFGWAVVPVETGEQSRGPDGKYKLVHKYSDGKSAKNVALYVTVMSNGSGDGIVKSYGVQMDDKRNPAWTQEIVQEYTDDANKFYDTASCVQGLLDIAAEADGTSNDAGTDAI